MACCKSELSNTKRELMNLQVEYIKKEDECNALREQLETLGSCISSRSGSPESGDHNGVEEDEATINCTSTFCPEDN